MTGQEGKYNIKAVSKLLGIQPGTLRAWERRYKIIAPVRNELGYRLYTDEQINVLKWLLKKLNEGFTIGHAVSLLENSPHMSEGVTHQEGNQLHNLSDELLNSLLDFNETKAQENINLFFSLYSIEKVIFEIFNLIFEKMEKLQGMGKITKAQKYFTTAILRARMERVYYSLPQNHFHPKAITACCPGESEDLSLLMLSLYLRRNGWEVIHIGTTIDEEEMKELLKYVRPDYLLFSCDQMENLTTALTIATKFSLNHHHLRIGLVGKAVSTMKKSEKAQFASLIVGENYMEWGSWLDKITTGQ